MVAPLVAGAAAAMRILAVQTGRVAIGAELGAVAEEFGAEHLAEGDMEVTVPVASSAIRSIGYHAAGIITVNFIRGGSYDYPGTEELFIAFVSAPSKGQFFNSHIK